MRTMIRKSRLVLTGALLAATLVFLALPALASPAHRRETEPNNRAVSADGPIGPKGILDRNNGGSDEDFFYFKVRPGRNVTITVKDVNGRCGSDPHQNFIKTARPNFGELHYFENVGGQEGASESYATHSGPHGLFIVGMLYPNDGHRGCELLTKVTPGDALIKHRTRRDKRLLHNPDVQDQ
jgi:hypothetical protein